MTPKQLAVLAFAAKNPECSGSEFVFVSTRLKWSAQGATRWGCGYAHRLVLAGMLSKHVTPGNGGVRYRVTPTGLFELTAKAFALAHASDIERTVTYRPGAV